MKTKVLFIATSTGGGGAERMQLNIMHSLSKDKYEIFFINTSRDSKPIDLYKNIHYDQYNKTHAKSAFFLLRKDLSKIKPQYIFTTSIVVAYLLQIIRKTFNFKTKLFVRIAVPPSEVYNKNWKSSILKIINSQVLRKVDLIIAQTEFSKIDIAEHYNVPFNKIKVIRNIIDKAMLECSGKAYIPKEYSDENYNIVASGALYSVKGFDLLIDSMVEIVKQKTNTRLYILGDERYEKGYKLKLKNQIKRNNLQRNVFLLGHQSNPYPYYKNADLFVLSSRKEGFPNVVLEALYYGTPVVASDCVDFTSVITNGINGYIVNKSSRIELSKGVLKANSRLKRTTPNNIENFNYENLFL